MEILFLIDCKTTAATSATAAQNQSTAAANSGQCILLLSSDHTSVPFMEREGSKIKQPHVLLTSLSNDALDGSSLCPRKLLSAIFFGAKNFNRQSFLLKVMNYF